MEEININNDLRRQSSHVRFNNDEYQKIREDMINTGKSIPTLLKERYFKGPRPVPLLAKSDATKFLGKLGRISNNLNQIARRVNSGIRAGFVGELDEIQKYLDLLLTFLTSRYCRVMRFLIWTKSNFLMCRLTQPLAREVQRSTSSGNQSFRARPSILAYAA